MNSGSCSKISSSCSCPMVRNFCARHSHFISRGNPWWRREMSSVFSQTMTSTKKRSSFWPWILEIFCHKLRVIRFCASGWCGAWTYSLFDLGVGRTEDICIFQLNIEQIIKYYVRVNNKQKTTSLWAKQQLCTCITLFSKFLWRPLHDYDVKPPNATFYEGREHTTTNFPFSFWTQKKSQRIQLQEKSPTLSGSK